MKRKLLKLVVAVVLMSLQANAQQSDKERAARNYITSQEKQLEIQSFHDFKLRFNRKGPSGETLRFQQMVKGVPVFESEIVVHFDTKGTITYSSDSYDKTVADIDVAPQFDEKRAVEISDNALKIEGAGAVTWQECKLYVHNKLGKTTLVYRVTTAAENLKGQWEAIIDAKTGSMLSLKDVAYYAHSNKDKDKKKKKEKQFGKSLANTAQSVTGTALIFNPDPLSVAGVAYGGQYVDNNDATNAALDAARSQVELVDIELLNGVYKLKSQYVEIKNLQNPNTGLFTQNTGSFMFNRFDQGFEAVNAFYHIDQSFRYINETLGIPLVPLQNNGVLFYDPHSFNGADNSSYASGALNFGEGGVDDAEDADVILHELGHGLHDWLTGGSLSQVNGLSEGSGDYWAQSYSRSLNQWSSGQAAYHYVFSWDGHNPFWPGRVTNYSATYPGGLVNQIHQDGQIWATALMKVYDQIGRTKVDKAFLEGLARTNSSTNQQNAAIAVRQAAIDMGFSCSDIQAFTTNFTATGYNMPALPLTIHCPGDQTVNANGSGNYTIPDFTGQTSAVTANCNATVTQSPAPGTIVPVGTHSITMTGTSGTSVSCNFSVLVQPALGTDDFSKQTVSVYPNPATNSLTVKTNFTHSEKVSVYNMIGQKVLEKTMENGELVFDVSQLSPGVYAVYFNNSKSSHKFVKK